MDAADRPISHIAICGSGLAAAMTAAALSHQLPPRIRISLVPGGSCDADIFYGNVTAPTAYAFNRSCGLAEPMLVTTSDCVFSWGTLYDGWVEPHRSWVQCFHLALPVIDGVMFHDYLGQQGEASLEPYLLPALAGRRGVFMHPPPAGKAAGQQLLSRAEYGYQIDPSSYGRLFEKAVLASRIERHPSALADVELGPDGIAGLQLSDGSRLTADLYIDCTGPGASLMAAIGTPFDRIRSLRAASSLADTPQVGAPLRTIRPVGFGWQSETPLSGSTARLTIYHPQDEQDALAAHGVEAERIADVDIGRRSQAWNGNCLAIGHAACVIEPLTPAPVILIERDIDRLLSLIPLSAQMDVERREYNRRFCDDHEHAELFTRTLFETGGDRTSPYWAEARSIPPGEKLARKLTMFADRGTLVNYDLEPFHPEDWTILHYGMGRVPARYDRVADRAPADRVRAFLAQMRSDISAFVDTLPPHAAYLSELKQYLARQRR